MNWSHANGGSSGSNFNKATIEEMSMDYDDALTAAIKRRFAPDFVSALQTADAMTLSGRKMFVNVPLRADVEVIYDKGLAAFIVTGTLSSKDKDKWLGGRQLFSTYNFTGAKDRAQIISYLFDSTKEQFLRALADGEIDELLSNK